MSNRLALSAAASVMMMSAFVLFGQGVARAPLRHDAGVVPISAEAPPSTGLALREFLAR